MKQCKHFYLISIMCLKRPRAFFLEKKLTEERTVNTGPLLDPLEDMNFTETFLD